MQSPHVSVQVDLERIRRNTAAVAARVGVPILATIKSDAYGLGAQAVARAIKDVVEGWCLFTIEEAIAIQLWRETGKPALAVGPPSQSIRDPRAYIDQHIRPRVSTAEEAAALRDARPVLSVDTGMQRFACPPEQIDAVLAAGG